MVGAPGSTLSRARARTSLRYPPSSQGKQESPAYASLVVHESFITKVRALCSFSKTWYRACREARVSGKIPHDFRRTAVRNMVRAGIPERIAMEIAGHETCAIFARYYIVSA